MKKLCALLAVLLLALPVAAMAETAVASFYPVYLLALNLTQGIEGVELTSLAGADVGCLHDYQLQTGDMKVLAKTDVLLINGAGMESYLTMVYDAFPELPVVDASVGVELLCADEEHDHGHDHEHAGVNAHIWLDVQNAITMTNNLCEGLAQAWPEHRSALESNRDAYILRLMALDSELEALLAPLQGKAIITFHEAFPYFAQAYGIEIAAVINRDPGDALSPTQLAALVGTVSDLGNPPLFIEPQYSDLSARTLAAETGASVYQLNPVVTGPTDETALTYYEDTMRQNAQVLLEALGE